MTEDSLHKQMQHYEQLATQVTETARKRDAVASSVQARLAETLTEAVTEQSATVEAVEQSEDGHRHRFQARLDRAALVAAVAERLPDGFVVSRINQDGTMSIEWTGTRETPTKRNHDAVLKAIISEEVTIDSDGLISEVPTHQRVLDRATALEIDEEAAANRLDRLARLEVIDIDDGHVYPDENFSGF